MLTDTAYLALLLDAPLQSWGFSSRFQRRTTGLHPTKSGVIGLICAAMGLAKGSEEERLTLPNLAKLAMISIVIPRRAEQVRPTRILPVRRLEDFHTVLNTRLASGKSNHNPVVTHRQYLCEARFGVILSGNSDLLARVQAALKDPVWGLWLGRKSCIPSEVIYRGIFRDALSAQRVLIGDQSLEQFTTISDVENFDQGTDSISDQPVSFGDGTSSGSDTRRYGVRRIRLEPAIKLEGDDDNADL
jgi:CRISPR system Cascade subunit CasD